MASVWLLPILVFIVGLIATGITLFVVIRMSIISARIDVTPNSPLIDATNRRQFTDGYCWGIVKTAIPRKNGTILFEFYPLDPEQGENKPRPEMQSVVVGKQYVRVLSRSEASSRREIIKILSRDPTDIPEKMRGEKEAEFLTTEGQKAWLERTFGKMIPEGDEAIHEAMRVFARGNITRATLAQLREEIQEIKNMFATQSEQDSKKTK